MPWFFYSILTSLSYVGMILSVRKLTNLGFSPRQILLFLTGFVFLGFAIINLVSLGDIWQSDKFLFFLLIMLVVGIFSVIGNWADFEGIKRAPNPGYSTAIRNTTILPVILFSVLIFGSEFSLLKLLGAILVMIGIALLVLEKKNYSEKKIKSSSWCLFAFLALFGFTIMTLAHKQGTLIPGVFSKEINLFMFGFNFLAFALLSRKELKSYFADKIKLKAFLPLVIVAAAFSFLANFLSITGLSLAPNPGYHDAIKNTNILLVTLLSIKLFSTGFKKYKILGVIAIMIGIIILVV